MSNDQYGCEWVNVCSDTGLCVCVRACVITYIAPLLQLLIELL